MPSAFEILAELFGVAPLPPVPGTPNGPAGYDPGIEPVPPLQHPADPPPAGASAGGAMGAADPNSPGYQAGAAAAHVWDNLTQTLQGIGLDLHNGIQGFQEGLPIFGTFVVLGLVFLIGLAMFLAEGEKSVIREVLPLGK
jgi:hypothetical protein